ncbi:serine protease [Paremcibacter congregatus]|uniref:S1 family peptidase n=1 Tax=Paremcibacter congregatus TaxID=2043170 RepID=UPI0030EEE47B|tara:strand:- start:8012 stop:8878 length:867 start_codon:yes stop_codon:yes gene_type:complete
MSKFYFWLSLFIIFTAISSSLPEGGVDSVPPVRPKSVAGETAPPPLRELRPEGEGQLKQKSRLDPEVLINVEQKQHGSMSTGTAFALSDEGIWGTARHVTEDCTRLIVLTSPRKGYRVEEVIPHPTADVSILKTAAGAKAFQIETDTLTYNAEGFHFGYPRGEPGNVYSRLIGRRIIKTQGARKGREAVLVWAEKIRQPDHNLSLGGISGGPVLNARGHLVGVHIAGSVRRGRSYSSLPETVTSLLQQTDYQAVTRQSDQSYRVDRLRDQGNLLRKRLSVAKVVCIVD